MSTDSSKSEQKSYRAWGVLGTVAATLTLVMIVSFGLLDDVEPPSGEGGGSPRSDETVPPDHATLAEAPIDLSWSPATNDASYTVVLYDADSKPIWESETTTAPRAVVPPEARTEIVPGAVYYWRVISVVGDERSPSALYRFTVEP